MCWQVAHVLTATHLCFSLERRSSRCPLLLLLQALS
jgi:hypothetical protein